MAAIERTYTIPLRREFLKSPKYKRTKKAVIGLRAFLVHHMKSEDVRIGKSVNLEIWKHGIRNPPSRVKVNVTKDDKGVVRAELFGAKVPRTAEKKEAKPETTPADAKTVLKAEQKPAETPKKKEAVKK